ncbi:MAG: hypothetical protein SVU32_00745 [Candidatus Nanohaloarchaea archaeon]|nr:hypothetical protein [Candidatus Nanohaloarchaea archaeon]
MRRGCRVVVDDIEDHVARVRKRIEELRDRADAIGLPDEVLNTGIRWREPTETQARWYYHVLNPARGAGPCRPIYEEAERIGLKEEQRGVSVTSQKQWKGAVESHRDRQYCLYLLDVIIDWNLQFWTYYHGLIRDWELVEFVEVGEIDYDSSVNVARTRQWLDDQNIPSSKPARQRTFTEVVQR